MKWLLRLLLLIVVLVALLLGWLFFGGAHQPTSPAMSKVASATLHDPALIAGRRRVCRWPLAGDAVRQYPGTQHHSGS
jgi:hypothetical protein